MVHEKAVSQWAEAGIDVIEARVCQSNRHDFYVEKPADLGMSLDFCPETISRPEPRTVTVEQAVTRTFKTDIVIEIQQVIAIFDEPLLEELLFGPPLMRHEMARYCLVAVNHARICREYHVRQFRLRLDRDNVGKFGDLVAQSFPLLFSTLDAQ